MKAVVFALVVVLALVAGSFGRVAVQQTEQVSPPLNCILCMNVVSILESLVVPNDTVSRITGIVDKTCTRFFVEDWCVAEIEPRLNWILPVLFLSFSREYEFLSSYDGAAAATGRVFGRSRRLDIEEFDGNFSVILDLSNFVIILLFFCRY